MPVAAFVDGLRAHGENLAVACGADRLTYGQLADRVDEVATAIGPGRKLVLVEAADDLAGLVGYLAALRGGHVALLAARADRAQVDELTARFDPDVVIGACGTPRPRRTGSRHRLHPELALLLPTSGSTGAPRLVRLSATALDANAAAIATYLEIAATDRALLGLPMHYCYGLSVVNSNLLCGAAVVLTGASVVEPAYWTAAREHGVTSLHGVPYTFELLERSGFDAGSLPSLRYVTQAGGRMAPERVRRWAEAGRRAGWRLFVMYGQTEATARMAYLPPELAAAHPEAVGVAIPGGALSVAPDGELLYRGPNVMLGYAEGPADLAAGRTVDVLHTGDLGRRRPDGLFEVVGRRSRFVKPYGVRTDLDALERLLAEHGVEAACAGTDARVVVAACGAAGSARAVLAERLPLPADAVVVVPVAELPRRPNGKLDHAAVLRLADHRRRGRPATVREIFARTFPGEELTDDVSFVELGGDSLTYVQVAADVERVLGGLPDGWDRMPLGRLAAATTSAAPRRATIETGVLLRALAVIFVVGEHAHLWGIVGGAHLLLALSGWTFARFVTSGGATPRRILHSAARMAVPSMAWIGFRAALHNVRPVDALLVGSLVPPLVAGYWYVDALVQILLGLALVFAVPALRRLEQRHPYGFAAVLLAGALAGRFFPTATGWWFTEDIYSTQVVLWLFVLGWMLQRARTPVQTAAGVAAVLVLVPTFFGADALRSVIVVAGLLLLRFRPTLRVPRPVAGAATAVAAASLGIYLTHFGVLPLASLGVPAPVVVAVSLATGIVATRVVTAVLRAAVPAPRRAAGERLPVLSGAS